MGVILTTYVRPGMILQAMILEIPIRLGMERLASQPAITASHICLDFFRVNEIHEPKGQKWMGGCFPKIVGFPPQIIH